MATITLEEATKKQMEIGETVFTALVSLQQARYAANELAHRIGDIAGGSETAQGKLNLIEDLRIMIAELDKVV